MPQNYTRRRWLLQYAAGVLLFCIPALYVEGHVLLGLPTRNLFEPISALSALFLFLGPFLYWARERAGPQKRDIRPLIAVAGAGGVIFCLLLIYYGARLGIIEGRTARESAIATLWIMPIGITFSYYIIKRFLRAG